MDWPVQYVGKHSELEALKRAWKRVKAGETRIVSLVAETGFGKTRTLHEFYHWLSISEDHAGRDGYWPDRLLRSRDNLKINPEPDELSPEMAVLPPYLWWGIRPTDQGQRNAFGGALWAAVQYLKPHLGHFEREAARRKLNQERLQTGLEAAVDISVDYVGNLLSFGLLGLSKTAAEKGRELWNQHQEYQRLNQEDVHPTSTADRKQGELVDVVCADLRMMARPDKGTPLPLVIVVDDVQFGSDDLALSEFFDQLTEIGVGEKWPLLVITTSWEREWNALSGAAAGIPGRVAELTDTSEVFFLNRVQGYGVIVDEVLPGLTPAQSAMLVDKVDGNGGYLEEILKLLVAMPKYFVKLDTRNPLNAAGEKFLLGATFQKVVTERLQHLPIRTRGISAAASLQGVTFSQRFALDVARAIGLPEPQEGLADAESPFLLVSLGLDGSAEFKLRAYAEAFREDLPNLGAEEDFQAAFDATLQIYRDLFEQSRSNVLDSELLLLSLRNDTVAFAALAEGSQRATERRDFRTAATLAKTALAKLEAGDMELGIEDVNQIVHAYEGWFPATQVTLSLREQILAARDRGFNVDSDNEGYEARFSSLLGVTDTRSKLGRSAERVLEDIRALLAFTRSWQQRHASSHADSAVRVSLQRLLMQCREMRRFDEASEVAVELLALSRRLAETGNRHSMIGLSRDLWKHSELLRDLDDMPGALARAREAVEAGRRALAANRDVEEARVLAQSLETLAHYIPWSENIQELAEILREALELRRYVVDMMHTPTSEVELLKTIQWQVQVLNARAEQTGIDNAEARTVIERAYEGAEDLLRREPFRNNRALLSNVIDQLEITYRQAGKLPECVPHLMRKRQLSTLGPSPEALKRQSNYVESMLTLAELLVQQQRAAEARPILKEIATLAGRLAVTDPAQHIHMLQRALRQDANASLADNNVRDARFAWSGLFSVAEMAHRHFDNAISQWNLAKFAIQARKAPVFSRHEHDALSARACAALEKALDRTIAEGELTKGELGAYLSAHLEWATGLWATDMTASVNILKRALRRAASVEHDHDYDLSGDPEDSEVYRRQITQRLDLCERLIAAGPGSAALKDLNVEAMESGDSGMFLAAFGGMTELAFALHAAGAAPLNANRLMKLVATARGDARKAQLIGDLVDALGCDSEQLGQLMTAAVVSDDPVTLALLARGHQPSADQMGVLVACTALWDAPEALSWLAAAGANPNAPINEGFTCLHLAAAVGHKDVVMRMVELGADRSAIADSGRTPLEVAAEFGNFETVRTLLALGADANRLGKDGLRPLHMAIRGGNLLVLQALLEAGAPLRMPGEAVALVAFAQFLGRDHLLAWLSLSGRPWDIPFEFANAPGPSSRQPFAYLDAALGDQSLDDIWKQYPGLLTQIRSELAPAGFTTLAEAIAPICDIALRLEIVVDVIEPLLTAISLPNWRDEDGWRRISALPSDATEARPAASS